MKRQLYLKRLLLCALAALMLVVIPNAARAQGALNILTGPRQDIEINVPLDNLAAVAYDPPVCDPATEASDGSSRLSPRRLIAPEMILTVGMACHGPESTASYYLDGR